VVLAMVQAYGFALFVAGLPNAVSRPGAWFTVQMMLFLTTGALFVMWLGEQITERGIGNGASLLIFFSIVQGFWPAIFQTVQLFSTGAIPIFSLLLLGVLMLASWRRWWP
jgi:preprotein translocase subunit SecY